MSQTSLHANQAMALSQLYTNDIHEPRLLETLAATPREMFVPQHLQHCAYLDEDVHIGESRYLLAPLDQARLIQAAGITEQDSVLDIACGMGFSTAVIAQLARRVIGIDHSAMFKQHAEQTFGKLGIHNAQVEIVEKIADGYKIGGPYDVIVINGSMQFVPDQLVSQLHDGGRLVFVQKIAAPPTGAQGVGKLMLGTRHGPRLHVKAITESFIPKLQEFAAPERFQFN